HSGNLHQGGRIALLAHLLAAVGVGEAVGLVLDGGDEGKGPPVHVDGDLLPVPVHDGAGAVVAVLDHAVEGDISQGGAGQRRLGGVDLAAAAVHQQKVGLFGKAGRLAGGGAGGVLSRPAGHRLGQGG